MPTLHENLQYVFPLISYKLCLLNVCVLNKYVRQTVHVTISSVYVSVFAANVYLSFMKEAWNKRDELESIYCDPNSPPYDTKLDMRPPAPLPDSLHTTNSSSNRYTNDYKTQISVC